MKLPIQTSPVMRTNKVSRMSQIIKQESLIYTSQSRLPVWLDAAHIAHWFPAQLFVSTIRPDCRDLEAIGFISPWLWQNCMTARASILMEERGDSEVFRDVVYGVISNMQP